MGRESGQAYGKCHFLLGSNLTPSGLGRGRGVVGSAPSSAPRTRHHIPGDASGNLRRRMWNARRQLRGLEGLSESFREEPGL